MEAVSIKFRGQKCFQGEWVGFDQIKPINLIIGRNNSGKSALLDLLRDSADLFVAVTKWDIGIELVLQEKHFTSLLADTDAPEGSLDDTVRELLDHFCTVEVEKGFIRQIRRHHDGQHFEWPRTVLCPSMIQRLGSIGRWGKFWNTLEIQLPSKRFLRLDAERDLQPEPQGSHEGIWSTPTGSGTTDLLRPFATEARLANTTLMQRLLEDLNEVFLGENRFTEVSVLRSQGSDHREESWEIHLAEAGKESRIRASASGSGIRSVIVILFNLLVFLEEAEDRKGEPAAISLEEPENGLHPSALRGLLRVLKRRLAGRDTKLFITTHSSAVLDHFAGDQDAQAVRVAHDGTNATVTSLDTHSDRLQLLRDLGGRPSDLMLANGVLWVEGPSDRIYLNRFIELFSGDEPLQEGRHYQIACYGGSAGEAVSFDPNEVQTDDLIRLLQLNHNVAVICDGDRRKEGDELKKFVQRFEKEVAELGTHGFFWATEPKEMEGYLPGEVFWQVRKNTKQQAARFPDPDHFDCFPSSPKEGDYWRKNAGIRTFDKVGFARDAVKHMTLENLDNRFDLAEQMERLVDVIRRWNG